MPRNLLLSWVDEANNAPKGNTHFDPIHAFPPFHSFLICHTRDHQFPLISKFISGEVTYEEEDLGLMEHLFYRRLAIEIREDLDKMNVADY